MVNCHSRHVQPLRDQSNGVQDVLVPRVSLPSTTPFLPTSKRWSNVISEVWVLIPLTHLFTCLEHLPSSPHSSSQAKLPIFPSLHQAPSSSHFCFSTAGRALTNPVSIASMLLPSHASETAVRCRTFFRLH